MVREFRRLSGSTKLLGGNLFAYLTSTIAHPRELEC